MASPDVIRTRIATAEHYLALVDSDLDSTWNDLSTEALIRQDLPLALALCHPQHWEHHIRFEALLGPRSFRTPTLSGTRLCSAADYWGVDCGTLKRRQVDIVADHAWPYSLGGPTHVANIRWLCRRHNAAKSSDIHFYPWEGLWPEWLCGLLERIRQVRGRNSNPS